MYYFLNQNETMKYIKEFNESIESESNLLSDALMMAFEDKNLHISEVGPSGLPFEILKRKYIAEANEPNDISFCIGTNTQPKLQASGNNHEIVISFILSDRYRLEIILRDFYRRIAKFGWSKISESMCNIHGYTVGRGKRPIFHDSTRIFKKIFIKKANVKIKKKYL